MAGDRIARATARIEAAVRRIEGAAQPAAAGGVLRQAQDDRTELASKYHALRSEAGDALAELDRLIGSLEP